MVRCVKCLLPDTKPGLVIDVEGICTACRHVEAKATIDYDARFNVLRKLCDKYRKPSGCDCIVTVSGGKDSTFQTYMLKEVLDMHPLLLHVDDNFEHTEAGKSNVENLVKRFNCDMITMRLGEEFNRKMMRWGFENIGSTNWAVDRAIYAWPLKFAIQSGIKLIVYGEDVAWEYGGVFDTEDYSAKRQISNDVVKPMKESQLRDAGCTDHEWEMMKYPIQLEIEESQIEPIYLSYFVKWDWMKILERAKECGFQTLKGEWERVGYADNFIQIDSIGYLFNYYVKYLKLCWSQTTHYVSNMIRWGHMTKEEGQCFIDAGEGRLDPLILADFARVTGYSVEEIDKICQRWVK
jgi:N-acetyl sugar amidotransferase